LWSAGWCLGRGLWSLPDSDLGRAFKAASRAKDCPRLALSKASARQPEAEEKIRGTWRLASPARVGRAFHRIFSLTAEINYGPGGCRWCPVSSVVRRKPPQVRRLISGGLSGPEHSPDHQSTLAQANAVGPRERPSRRGFAARRIFQSPSFRGIFAITTSCCSPNDHRASLAFLEFPVAASATIGTEGVLLYELDANPIATTVMVGPCPAYEVRVGAGNACSPPEMVPPGPSGLPFLQAEWRDPLHWQNGEAGELPPALESGTRASSAASKEAGPDALAHRARSRARWQSDRERQPVH